MKPRAFTPAERSDLRAWWPDAERWPVAALCRVFGCSSKTLVREIRSLGLGLRKPQRKPWEKVA